MFPHANNFRTAITKVQEMNPRSASSPKWNSILLPRSSAKFGAHCETGVKDVQAVKSSEIQFDSVGRDGNA